MKILNTIEQDAFERPPVFNSVQRKRYFDLHPRRSGKWTHSCSQKRTLDMRTPV
jgi:hypothetical protein